MLLKANFTDLFTAGLQNDLKNIYSKYEDDYFKPITNKNMPRLDDEKQKLQDKISGVVHEVSNQESMFIALQSFNQSVNSYWSYLTPTQKAAIKNLMKEILDI